MEGLVCLRSNAYRKTLELNCLKIKVIRHLNPVPFTLFDFHPLSLER